MNDETPAPQPLPAGFDDLTPLVAAWALHTEQERYSKRLATPLPALRAFYEALFPRMDAVLTHLSAYPADAPAALPVPVRNLYHLALSCFEASHPVELKWKAQDLDKAFPASRIVYQAPSDREN